jgi:hypothetical protein
LAGGAAAEREIGEHTTDIVATDTIIRVAIGLADDVQRWSRRRR